MTAETLSTLKAAQQDTTSYIGVPVETGTLDALWFSRPSMGNTTAWEIRLVSPTPLSLLEKISNTASDDERNAKLKEMEDRLLDLISRRKEAIEEIIAENAGASDDDDDDLDDDELDAEENGKKPKGNGRYK